MLGEKLAKIHILGGQGTLSDNIGDLNIKVFNGVVCATVEEPMGGFLTILDIMGTVKKVIFIAEVFLTI